MSILKINKNEIFEISLRKFKKLCEKSGILLELKKKEFYIKPTVKRKNIKNIKNRLIKKINYVYKNVK